LALVKQLVRVGNSTGVILDQAVLRQVGLEHGSEVEVRVERDRIVLTPRRYASAERFDAAKGRVFSAHKRTMERLAKR